MYDECGRTSHPSFEVLRDVRAHLVMQQANFVELWVFLTGQSAVE